MFVTPISILQRAGGGRGRRAAGMAERAANCGRGRRALPVRRRAAGARRAVGVAGAWPARLAAGGHGRRGRPAGAANCGRGRSADWRAGLLLPTTTATAASSAWKAQARRARLDDAAGIGVLLAALERIRMPVLSFLSNPLTMQAL